MTQKPKKLKNIKTGLLSRSLSLAKLGLQTGAKAAGSAVTDFFASDLGKELRKKAYLVEQTAIIAKELGELKGSLMKAGQMLSVYGEHFLPPEANQFLKTLQNDSPPVEWPEIKKILTKNLGKEKLEQLKIEEESYAAASLAQVHRATLLKSKEEIVLKLQYPGVDKAIDGDLKALKKALSLLDFLPKLPATDEVFAEVKTMLHHELNYERERSMLDFFRKTLKDDPRYIIPRSYPEFSNKRILAMSFEEGVKIDGAEVKALPQKRRDNIARAALELYFNELFNWKKVQTDAHFGNFRVRIGKNKDSDQLILFDFGAVREIDSDFIEKYKKMLKGIFYHDRVAFEKAASSLGVLEEKDPQELKDLFFELCSIIMTPFYEKQPFSWKNNDLPQQASKLTWEIFRRFPLRSPPREIVFLDRKMAGIFILMRELEPQFNAREVLESFL